MKPWWTDAEKLAWVVMTVLVMCGCAVLVALTFMLIRWML